MRKPFWIHAPTASLTAGESRLQSGRWLCRLDTSTTGPGWDLQDEGLYQLQREPRATSCSTKQSLQPNLWAEYRNTEKESEGFELGRKWKLLCYGRALLPSTPWHFLEGALIQNQWLQEEGPTQSQALWWQSQPRSLLSSCSRSGLLPQVIFKYEDRQLLFSRPVPYCGHYHFIIHVLSL